MPRTPRLRVRSSSLLSDGADADGRVGYVQGPSAPRRDWPLSSANRPEGCERSFSVRRRDSFGPALRERFRDGPGRLRLHIRSYGSRVASALPVVCLPALARTAADFHPLAAGLAADPAKPRLVLAIDYRGHGQSEYDRNPDNYTLPVALADLSAILTALEIAPLTLNPTARRLDSERFKVYPKDLRALPGHPEPAVSWHSGFRAARQPRRRAA
jgi:hypothetical protein